MTPCPGCQRAVAGDRCFYCGTWVRDGADAPTRSCPRCDVALVRKPMNWVAIAACELCGGELYEGDQFLRALRITEEWRGWLDERYVQRTHEVARSTPIACPSCSVPMDVFMGGQTAIDRCPQCDCVWLDAGEGHRLRSEVLAEIERRGLKDFMVRTQAQLDSRGDDVDVDL